jgi:hypothetical protein
MPNLKPYLDAARSADTEVSRIMNEIDTHFTDFTDGNEDGKKKALDLRPALDDAKIKAEQANTLYVSMRDASLIGDHTAALFSAPSDPAQAEPSTPNVVNLSGWNTMTPRERLAFAKAGGKLED